MASSQVSGGFARHAIILGFLSIVSPLAIDMYVPSLPEISADLHAPISAVQISLSAYFLALALGPLPYGLASDVLGRKPPLYFGMVLYALASIGCALAPSINLLILLRFVQGVGACASVVITRAIVRDLHTGLAAARLMSLIMLVFSVSPMVAPLLGSTLAQAFGWRSVFAVNASMGVAGLAIAIWALAETRPPEARSPAHFGHALMTCWLLLRDRTYLGLVLMGGLSVSAFYAFLAASSFVYVTHFGVSPQVYSLLFSVCAAAFIGGAQLTPSLGRRVGLRRLVRIALLAFAALTLGLFGLFAAGVDDLRVLVGMLLVAFGCLGFVIPSAAVLALEDHGRHAGMAAALMGMLQTGIGVLATAMVGFWFDGTAVPMLAVIAGCGLSACGLAQLTLGARRGRPPQRG